VVSDAELLDSVAAVARIAVSNAQLHASVGERLDDLVASRRRIVESADRERLRLERRIRLGPQARLDEVRRALTGCAGSDHQPEFAALVVEAVAEVDRAIAELGEFAAGVRPRVLSERGLGPGVTELAARLPIPVRVVAPDARFPPAVEAVGYFICAEGLANIGKHAAASSAAVEVTARRSSIVVAISDDGRGAGAGVEGSGLTGLRDRVEALGGVLTVRSAPGAGTRLQAVLPLVHS
jgi:signal transduction histidine kinase